MDMFLHRKRARWIGRVAAVFMAAGAVIMLSACSSSQGKVGTTQVTETAAGPVAEVILKDYEIVMPESVPPGTVKFNITNAGSHDHNFQIEVGDTKKRLDADLKPGATGTLVVALTSGTYDVECPVGLHSTMGMRRKLMVPGGR
ncbi:MAG TPA: cupredoxin domain-containing protein [Vicinamibacterales bacterium]|nr:cupredoxin domain-containing protein [Vicinamibacterales bacterium]